MGDHTYTPFDEQYFLFVLLLGRSVVASAGHITYPCPGRQFKKLGSQRIFPHS